MGNKEHLDSNEVVEDSRFELPTSCMPCIQAPGSTEPTKQVDIAEKTAEIPGSGTEIPKSMLGTDSDGNLILSRRRIRRKPPTWQPIETAPKDGTEILVVAVEIGVLVDPLPPLIRVAAYHPDAGFTICGIRTEIAWMPLPAAPPSEVGG
jgi:hypothetical protein